MEITLLNTRSAANDMYCENQPLDRDTGNNRIREVSYKTNKWKSSRVNYELLENISRTKLQEIVNALNSSLQVRTQIKKSIKFVMTFKIYLTNLVETLLELEKGQKQRIN